MRLICPNCRQAVTLADSAAGQPTPCPSCGQTFTPPALTGSLLDAAPPPAPLTPPTPAPAPRGQATDAPRPPTPTVSVASAPATIGSPYCRLTLRRSAAPWLAPVALVILFVLTFFSWGGMYPNGRAVYTQSAWQAVGGYFLTDSNGENVMKREITLQKNIHWSGWLTLYIILLIPTVVLAAAERIVSHPGRATPAPLQSAWPHRHFILMVLCAALFLVLLAALFFGFGLEVAATQAVKDAVPMPTAAADGTPPPTPQIENSNIRRDVEVAAYALHRTDWLTLAVLAQLVALFGAGLTFWLDRHPNAPEPRVECYC